MNTHNFTIVGGDTDSIMFCKPDMVAFSEEEQEHLLEEINNLLPQEITFANDGMFPKVLYLKAKNYIMIDKNGKRKIKGSAFKSSTLEPRLKILLNDFIDALFDQLDGKDINLLEIYHRYIKEASNITDITPWAKKVTLSATTYKSERKNETNIIDAIQGTEYVEGDKVRIYTKADGTLKLADKFDGDYNRHKYYEKIYKTVLRFSTVIDTSIFKNFKNKGNAKLLEEVLNK